MSLVTERLCIQKQTRSWTHEAMCTTQHSSNRFGSGKTDSHFHECPETPSPSGIPSAPASRTPEGVDTPQREREILDAAGRLCDFNVQLLAHIETLRSRVLELEEENASLRERAATQASPSQGDESLIHLLQVQVADLERQLYHAKIARRSAEENEAAARERSDMLAVMLEQSLSHEN